MCTFIILILEPAAGSAAIWTGLSPPMRSIESEARRVEIAEADG
jgi:hypothetical protein